MLASYLVMILKIGAGAYSRADPAECFADPSQFDSKDNFQVPPLCYVPAISFAMQFQFYYLQVIDSLKDSSGPDQQNKLALKVGI